MCVRGNFRWHKTIDIISIFEGKGRLEQINYHASQQTDARWWGGEGWLLGGGDMELLTIGHPAIKTWGTSVLMLGDVTHLNKINYDRVAPCVTHAQFANYFRPLRNRDTTGQNRAIIAVAEAPLPVNYDMTMMMMINHNLSALPPLSCAKLQIVPSYGSIMCHCYHMV